MNLSVLGNLSYGMYAIGTKCGGEPNACIATSVIQISSGKTKKLLVTLTEDTYSVQGVRENGIFTVSVLSTETPASVIGALGLVSGKNTNKLKNIRHKVLLEGVPVIKENTCCWFLCKVTDTLDTGNEVVFAAEIIAGSERSMGTPMTYTYYREVLHGFSPEGSPAYLPPNETFDVADGEKFICPVCGYVYRDPDFPFDEVRDSWTCPVCRTAKSAFMRVN